MNYDLGTPLVEQHTSSQKDLHWAMFAHWGTLLSAYIPILSFVIPFAIMQAFKDDSEYVYTHAREALNFQLTLVVYYIMSVILMLIVVGFIMMPVIYIASIALSILAGIKASKGEHYKYPFNMDFIK